MNSPHCGQALLELVDNRTGLNNTDVSSIWTLYDTLFCEVRGDSFGFSAPVAFFLQKYQIPSPIASVTECRDLTIKQQCVNFEVRC